MKALAITLLPLLLGGCITVRNDAGVGDVQTLVRERANIEFEPDAAVSITTDDPRVRSLLEGELTADRAVAVALANNPRLQMTLAELGLARADLVEASTISNPGIHGEIRFPGEPHRPFELSLAQSLLDLLQLRRNRAIGRAAFEAAKLRVAAEVLQIAADVRDDYYDLLAAAQQLAMSRTIAESARTAAEVAQRQHAAGNITDLDLETQQALYEEAKLELARNEQEALVRREALNRALGLRDPSIDWKIPEQFPPPPDEPARVELDNLIASRRLDVAAGRRELEVAQRTVPGARLSQIGEILVDLHHEREPDGTKTTGPGLELPIPIFNRGRAARMRAEARVARARARLADLTVAAATSVRALQKRLATARARLEYYRDVLIPRRERIVALTQLEYNAMVAGIYQLLQARENLARARRDFIEAQRDYWRARNDFERALNGIDSEEVREAMREPMLRDRRQRRRGGH